MLSLHVYSFCICVFQGPTGPQGRPGEPGRAGPQVRKYYIYRFMINAR